MPRNLDWSFITIFLFCSLSAGADLISSFSLLGCLVIMSSIVFDALIFVYLCALKCSIVSSDACRFLCSFVRHFCAL